MAARTKARKRALDLLFEAEQRGANVSAVLDERIAHSGVQTPLPEYAIEIVRGVVAQWPEINVMMETAAQDWTVARMPAVDRALLRIATWEIVHNPDVPTAVAIDEAVDLARDLSTDDSPGFINGVLAAIAQAAASRAAHEDGDPVE